MSLNLSMRIKKMIHHWAFWLVIITSFGIFVRMLPSLLNPAWGVDFGIYYGLTNSFVETKSFINSYDGWGSSYQYFPVLYAITGFAHFITGIDILHLLPKIAPIFGGLTIAILYFIVYDLFKSRSIALISAVLLSTATFHVYQTSHAAPLTIGHFFMMISLFFFLRFIKNSRYLLPLLISTGLLIMSHHFTMYFYIISITFILFGYARNHPVNWRKSWFLLSYVLLASSAAFAYWIFVATPVYQSFMNGTLMFSSLFVILLYYLSTITGFLFCMYSHKMRRIISFPLLRIKERSTSQKVVISFTSILILSFIAMHTGIPGVYISLTPLAVLYSIPMILLASFSLSGLSLMKKRTNGYLAYGWIIALLSSFLFSILSAKLMPDRHLEYLIIPLCIPAALCIHHLVKNHTLTDVKSLFPHQPLPHPSLSLKPHIRRIAIPVIVASLIIANTMAAYPTIDALDSLDERVSNPCFSAMEWMDGNVSHSSVIASDHRLSMLCWANGYNITFGRTNTTWISEDVTGCIHEFQQLNITHILIDDIMRDKVTNVDVGKYFHLTNESYDKFMDDPFTLVFRNASVNNKGEEVHWIELYKINYSRIDITGNKLLIS